MAASHCVCFRLCCIWIDPAFSLLSYRLPRRGQSTSVAMYLVLLSFFFQTSFYPMNKVVFDVFFFLISGLNEYVDKFLPSSSELLTLASFLGQFCRFIRTY